MVLEPSLQTITASPNVGFNQGCRLLKCAVYERWLISSFEFCDGFKSSRRAHDNLSQGLLSTSSSNMLLVVMESVVSGS